LTIVDVAFLSFASSSHTTHIAYCFFLRILTFTPLLFRLHVLWRFGVNSNLHMLQICGMKPWTNDLEPKYVATFTCLMLQYVCVCQYDTNFLAFDNKLNRYLQPSNINHKMLVTW